MNFATGQGESYKKYCDSTPVAAMAGIRVRSVAAGSEHSLALGWDGHVYTSGSNFRGQLGHGDYEERASPLRVEGLEGVRSIAGAYERSLAVTQSGDVFSWGEAFVPEAEDLLRPIMVEGFESARVRRVLAGADVAFAIGEDGELFSWGFDRTVTLGHGDLQDQPSPKRVEALRGVRTSSVAVGSFHAVALTEEGLVYVWGESRERSLLGDLHVERELLPKPVEALRGVRVGSVAAAHDRSYVVADTGELWAWRLDGKQRTPLDHGEHIACLLPKVFASLQGVKVDAVAATSHHVLALADDSSVHVWGNKWAAGAGALGLGPSVLNLGEAVAQPQRIPALHVACHGL
jgi:alpha-tubulin suppressor-like RCC1 family protein